MSTGAHNSARFPYVSPVGTMQKLHIADGGYFENSGAGTAADLVDVIRRHPDSANIRPYVILIITRKEKEDEPSFATFANELIAPVRTLFATRGAHARAEIAEIERRTPAADLTTFKLVQHEGERFPLGWLLAARTRDLIDKQMGPQSVENGANVARIAAALGVQPGADTVWGHANDAIGTKEK